MLSVIQKVSVDLMLVQDMDSTHINCCMLVHHICTLCTCMLMHVQLFVLVYRGLCLNKTDKLNFFSIVMCQSILPSCTCTYVDTYLKSSQNLVHGTAIVEAWVY